MCAVFMSCFGRLEKWSPAAKVSSTGGVNKPQSCERSKMGRMLHYIKYSSIMHEIKFNSANVSVNAKMVNQSNDSSNQSTRSTYDTYQSLIMVFSSVSNELIDDNIGECCFSARSRQVIFQIHDLWQDAKVCIPQQVRVWRHCLVTTARKKKIS